MPTLDSPCLMVLTDRTQLTPSWALAQAAATAITGGASIALFQETDLPPSPRASVFRFMKDGVRGRVPLVAMGEPAWAIAQGADGVHLENTPTTVAEARAALGADAWIGVTVSSLEQARDAEGADYLLILLDWTDSAAALRVVEAFAAEAPGRLVAGSDVPLDHAAACIDAGAAGVAITHAAMGAYDRTTSVRQYAEAIGRGV